MISSRTLCIYMGTLSPDSEQNEYKLEQITGNYLRYKTIRHLTKYHSLGIDIDRIPG